MASFGRYSSPSHGTSPSRLFDIAGHPFIFSSISKANHMDHQFVPFFFPLTFYSKSNWSVKCFHASSRLDTGSLFIPFLPKRWILIVRWLKCPSTKQAFPLCCLSDWTNDSAFLLSLSFVLYISSTSRPPTAHSSLHLRPFHMPTGFLEVLLVTRLGTCLFLLAYIFIHWQQEEKDEKEEEEWMLRMRWLWRLRKDM